MTVKINGQNIPVREEMTLYDLSKLYEDRYEFPIIVAKVDGVIQELYHHVQDGSTISFCF